MSIETFLYARVWQTGLGEFVFTPDSSIGQPTFSLTMSNGEIYGSNRFKGVNAAGKSISNSIPPTIFDQPPKVKMNQMGLIKVVFTSGPAYLLTYMQRMHRKSNDSMIESLLTRIRVLELKIEALETRPPPIYSEEKS